MLLRSHEKKPTKKRRYVRAAIVLIGLPAFLAIVIILEAINNPALFSRKYLLAEYGPTVLWPLHHGYNAFDLNEPFLASTVDAVANALDRLDPATADIPEMVLDVKYKEIAKIYEQREQAMRAGRLIQTDDSFVTGKIREDSENVRVKLRLKGDWLDHLQGRKWSFRVHTRKGKEYFGMRKFSVQHPKTRGYQAEKLYFDLLRDYGVLAPRSMLVNLMLNGDDLGIMLVEEHFSKELLESQSRREGIIVRFDESLVWLSPDGNNLHFLGIYDDYRNASVDTFESSKVAESPLFSQHNRLATGLLRAFANGELQASDVFDVETLGAYLAVTEVFGSFHAIRWHNQRFYVNPITLKLEPIGFDAHLEKRAKEGISAFKGEPIATAMLKDPLVMARYREVLSQLAADADSGELLDQLRESEQQFYDVLKTEYIYLQPYPAEEVSERARYFGSQDSGVMVDSAPTEVLGPVSAELYPVPVHAYRYMQGETEYLELSSAIQFEVQISGLIPAGVGEDPPLLAVEGLPLNLPPRKLHAVVDTIRVALPATSADVELLVTGTVGERSFREAVMPYHPVVRSPGIPVHDIQAIAAAHEFIDVNESTHEVLIKAGTWNIPELISFPVGYRLTIPRGTELRFGPDAGLIIRGTVSIAGTAEQPVRFRAMNEEKDSSWLGLAVLEAGAASEWRHAEISGTRGMSWGPWLLMGGTNFYRSPVTIESSAIRHHRGEDGLNIISSEFLTRDLTIEDTLSDGFDCDFCSGEVLGGKFQHIGTAGGGDAIDVSLSNIIVKDVRFSDVSDKAISIGEQSTATATGLLIESSGTGAAAKDGSRLILEDSTITGSKVSALMAYVKEPEFGAAELIARNLKLKDNRTIAVAQTGSRIELDGVPVKPEDVDVDAMYDTIMRPGLRRPNLDPQGDVTDAGT